MQVLSVPGLMYALLAPPFPSFRIFPLASLHPLDAFLPSTHSSLPLVAFLSSPSSIPLERTGLQVRVTPSRTEIIILATRTQNVLGNKGQRIRELTSVVQKRFNYPDGAVELYAEKVNRIVWAANLFRISLS